MNRLTEGKSTSQQVQAFLLKDIFLKPNYGVIKRSYGRFLSRSNLLEEVLEQYGNGIGDVITLHTTTREINAKIIGILLDSVQAGEHSDTVNELLLAYDFDK